MIIPQIGEDIFIRMNTDDFFLNLSLIGDSQIITYREIE